MLGITVTQSPGPGLSGTLSPLYYFYYNHKLLAVGSPRSGLLALQPPRKIQGDPQSCPLITRLPLKLLLSHHAPF